MTYYRTLQIHLKKAPDELFELMSSYMSFKRTGHGDFYSVDVQNINRVLMNDKRPVREDACYAWFSRNAYSIERTGKKSLHLILLPSKRKVGLDLKLSKHQMNKFISCIDTYNLQLCLKAGRVSVNLDLAFYSNDVPGNKSMGVDLGIKIPAVAACSNGNYKFFGSGRQDRYKRTLFNAIRKKDKLLADRKQTGYMTERANKVASDLISFAVKNEVGFIFMEDLERLNTKKGMATWDYFRLYRFINYKAAAFGIKVIKVDARFTSQRCPKCGSLNTANDRDYHCCYCGYKNHRDLVGALNIMEAGFKKVSFKTAS